MEFYRALDTANCWLSHIIGVLHCAHCHQVLIFVSSNNQITYLRVNFPVVGFAAHALAAICYFAASVILIYSLTVDEENPLFQPKDR